MWLTSLQDVDLAFGGPPLLHGANLRISEGERVCLLGRNGAGKTSLMRLLAGELPPDRGEVARRQNLTTALLAQDVPLLLQGSIHELVTTGLGPLGSLLAEYHRLSADLAAEGGALDRLAEFQQMLDREDGWQAQQKVKRVISRMGLDPDTACSSLSAGMKRRVLLARALVSEPDLLLLDEPTNHLDLATITWLEQFLAESASALLFVSHDRAFLGRLATRVVELDRGQIHDWNCDYLSFQRRRAEDLDAEESKNAEFDRRLAREEKWIRKGVKARRTRDEGRVKALEAMRAEREARRERTATADMRVEEARRTGKLVFEAQGVSYAWDDRMVVHDFSTLVIRGDRVGLIGPNGSGKTTLLGLLLGLLPPDQGRVREGVNLAVARFDQLREQLEEDRTVKDNIGGGADVITLGGKPCQVMGYLQRFLFSPERANTPVRALSGGERSRLLLARLFARPSNVLVLDEPTNDLDLETLELLEELLIEYRGTLLLVSHDRAFLNNVVTSTLVFEGQGKVTEYVGGYDDWLRQRPPEMAAPAVPRKTGGPRPPRQPKPGKLSYRDQRELDALPGLIEKLETEQTALFARMENGSYYRSPAGEIARDTARLSELENELAAAYDRWQALESEREAGPVAGGRP
jgi:ATP-binding cassette subfamily F protein uup